MTTTASHKLLSSLTRKASVLTLILLMIGGILFTAPSTMAQQQQTTTAPTTTQPLTPEEQREQDRLENTVAAITRNLQQGRQEVNGIVYTPRWSEPVWVQPSSLSILFVYCLPGEYADSGQEILGGSELEVLETYSLSVTRDLTGWLMVVENEEENVRLPAAVGVICSSDTNDVETRVLSPEEQTEINNIIKQFITIRTTVITNITNVINIINNITTNGTGGVTPPPTNDTGEEPLTVQIIWDTTDGGTAPATFEFTADANFPGRITTYSWDFGDGQQRNTANPTVFHTFEDPGNYTVTVTVTDTATKETVSASESVVVHPVGVTPEPLTVSAYWDTTDGGTAPATYSLEGDVYGGRAPYTWHWDFGDGQEATFGGCCASHRYENPGQYTATLTVTDSLGNTASDSTTVSVSPPLPNATGRLEIGWSSNPQDGTEAPASWCFNADVRGGVPPYTSYSWDFGDGGTASGQDVCHTFEQPGTYDVTLTATDSEGTVRSETGHIAVDPPLETTTPPPTADETGVTEPTTNDTGGP